MDTSQLFWSSSIEDIKKGYIYDEKTEEYKCLMCGEAYERGIIYKDAERLCDAEKYMKLHIKRAHNSVFHYLINMNKRYTGLTEVQQELLTLFKEGISDKEIADKLQGSSSTIRNHRFKLREKEKQAKVFLAIMGLLLQEDTEEINDSKKKLIDIHKEATMIDERYAITEEERLKTIETYFDEKGYITKFPSKAKKKIIVLQEIVKKFSKNQQYSEKEINETLKQIHEDYVTIRRSLIEYGFMKRTDDCSSYWVNN
ncbi:MAG: DUF2087 domain-containing protein [Bacillota bacterium]|nr:DUF2087 domain-containing protein [Bacillota bacterium]